MRNSSAVANVLKTAIGSHLYGYQDLLAPKIADACIQVAPKVATNFSVDNVRVAKIVGGGVADTEVIKGFVLTRGAEGIVSLFLHLCYFCFLMNILFCVQEP